jgi:hypothetical protein
MTAAQERYRDALLAAAGDGASWSWSDNGLGRGAVKITIVRAGRSVARAIVERDGRLYGAWDPQHLTDNINVREENPS